MREDCEVSAMVTGIGSLPFTNVDEAIDRVFAVCPEAPVWPQLPRRSFLEDMYVQCMERVPSVVIDEAENRVYVDSTSTAGIEAFYEDVGAGRVEAFSLSEQAAPGLYRFLERLSEIEERVRVIKGQLTGPFTLGLGLKDEKGQPILYNDAYFDIIKKALHMKARWMISFIRERFPDKQVLIFFDEPFMVSFGSAFVSISKDHVISLMNDVIRGLDAMTGVHCCGNTDWSVLYRVETDVINYDAFNFLDTVFYYREELAAFLKRGGMLAPGIVPSSEAVLSSSVEDLRKLWLRFGEQVAGIDPSAAWRDWFVTPSCGLGSLTEPQATRALELLAALDASIRRE
jgi:methionine synthase II (cobalamin-independent)